MSMMVTPDVQQQMNRSVQSFLGQVTELARRAAIDALQSTLGDRGARTQVTTSAAPVGRLPGRRGGKRTSADLEALAQRFVTFVRGNPGLRIEQINRTLGTETKDLALPIRKLIASKVIRVRGHQRSTIYFAADSRRA